MQALRPFITFLFLEHVHFVLNVPGCILFLLVNYPLALQNRPAFSDAQCTSFQQQGREDFLSNHADE